MTACDEWESIESYASPYLCGDDLDGREHTVEIASVDLESMPNEQGDCKLIGVITFKNRKKRLVVNKTNMRCIVAMFGRNPQDCIGKRLTIAPEKFRDTWVTRITGSPDITGPIEVWTIENMRRRIRTMQKTHCEHRD